MPKAEGLTRPPIDAEELAAFIDGRLEGERRRRVIERLAEDEEAYELYSAVIEVREELAAEGADSAVPQVPPAPEGGAAAPFRPATSPGADGGHARRRGKLLGWWRSERSGIGRLPAAAAIAAGVAVAVLAAWWVLRPIGSRQLLAAFDAATVTPAVASEAPERLEPVFRSGNQEERGAQFKLGARAFDLALAVEAGEPESAAKWLDEMSRLLEQVPASFGLSESYQELARRLGAGEPLRSLRRDIAEAEQEVEAALDLPEQPLFAFGRWLEAVRTAAAHRDRRFLASRAAREPLPAFLSAAPPAEVSSRLEEIGAALGSGATTADLDAVAHHAMTVIEHCADGRPCLGQT